MENRIKASISSAAEDRRRRWQDCTRGVADEGMLGTKSRVSPGQTMQRWNYLPRLMILPFSFYELLLRQSDKQTARASCRRCTRECQKYLWRNFSNISYPCSWEGCVWRTVWSLPDLVWLRGSCVGGPGTTHTPGARQAVGPGALDCVRGRTCQPSE